MKKSIAVLLVLILSMSMMAGCSKKKDTKKEETTGDTITYTKGTSDGGLDFNPEDYVTLGEYKNLPSYKVTCSVSDEELQSYIEGELEAKADYPDITDRGAKKGDLITFDYVTTVDGKEVMDCTYEDYEITLGDSEFDETVEKEMIGKKPEDSFEVKLTLSDDLSESNAGDDAVMKITVKKLEEQVIPELNDDYARNNGCDNVDDFKNAMKEQMISDKEQEMYTSLIEDLMIAAADNATLKDDYPESLYNTCKKEVDESIDANMEMMEGITRAEFLELFYGMTEEDLKSQYLIVTQERLLIYAIAQKESLFLTEEQYQDYLEVTAADNEMKVEEIEQEADRETLMYSAVYDNVAAFLYDNAKKETITDEEYEKMNPEVGEEVEEASGPEEEAEDSDIDSDEGGDSHSYEYDSSDDEDGIILDDDNSIILDDAEENVAIE